MLEFNDDQYVNTKAKLEALDRILMDKDRPIYSLLAFDTETNGTEFHEKVIIGFSLAFNSKKGYYVPLLEWVPETKFFKKDKKILEELLDVYPNGHFTDVWTGEILPELVTSKQWAMPESILKYLKRWTDNNLIMHNAAFDCNMVIYNTGLDLAKNLFCDTILLKHTIDENPPHGLKEVAKAWKEDLGFNPEEDANSEMKELGKSVLRNGGNFSPRIKYVWRGDGYPVAKYAAADAALTFGVYEVGIKKLTEQYSEKHVEWFFEKEVMPLAREVVIPMTCGGMFVDTLYFKELVTETQGILNRLEDEAHVKLGDLIKDCEKGEDPEDLVSTKALYEKIMQMENLEYPSKLEKGQVKQSLAKACVKKAYENTGHWLFAFMLGEVEKMEYSDEKIEAIKEQIYSDKHAGKPRPRYKFNIKSGYHLRWVLFDKLGNDPALYPQTKGATDEDPEASLAGEILEEHFKGKYPFIDPVIRFLKLHKLISTYARPLIKKQHSGYVHMDMRQFGTTSGRFACRRPNMQNLPAVKDFGTCVKCESKNVTVDNPAKLLANIKCGDCGHEVFETRDPSAIKRGFIAPPGFKIVNADFESLEPKCFAFMSGDEGLKAVYKQGLDLYSKVYCDMFDPKNLKYSPDPKSPKFLKKVAPDKRKEVKPIVLGIPYGEDDWKVANELGLMIIKDVLNEETGKYEKKEFVNVDEGRRLRNLYLDAYPKLRNYMYECEQKAMVHGYVETLVGRRRHFKLAPIMGEILARYGVEPERFLSSSHKRLEGETVKSLGLTKNDLWEVSKTAGIPYGIIKENGCWGFVKTKFKNELNNAKNFPIQGLAAHITNAGMIDIMRAFGQHGIDGYVALQVHDEITCYVREDQVEPAKKIVQDCMERNWVTALLDIPMKAEPIIATNLKEAK